MRPAVVVLLAFLAAGCSSNTLETGYRYTPIGAPANSGAQRRAYYSGPFSREARAAQAEQQNVLDNRRPDGNVRP